MEEPQPVPTEDQEPHKSQTEETAGDSGASNPDQTSHELLRGQRLGDRHVHIQHPFGDSFRRVSLGHLRATREVLHPRTPFQGVWLGLKRLMIGRPLSTEREIHERLNKVRALAVFASDAISSCAYATEEILIVLMAAGSGALGLSVPISLLIAVLLSIVAFSYRQTVYAYPSGGGSYIVARENIGEIPSLIAAAALMLDYVLTVSVSISSGTDAITSAFPVLHPLTIPINLFFILFITFGNLRGIRESGTIFAIPTYAFIFGLGVVLVVGLFRYVTGSGPAEAVAAPPIPATTPITLWLLLTAFSAGSVAMSGTEAISNGVPAFKPPESRNAATTLTLMATLLGVFFLGISFLASHFGLAPDAKETIISQLGRTVLGKNVFYYFFQFATMGILVVAANTSFADFPRLASLLARDNYLPHQFAHRGDRLAFSTGIVALGMIAALLTVVFEGDVHLLIPLYAVGVFLAFTMSQSGMVLHWRKTRQSGWQHYALINGFGAILTSIVLVIAGVTKFSRGAWIIIVAVPIIVALFLAISRHYHYVAAKLKLQPGLTSPLTFHLIVLVVVPSLNYATQRALIFARTISKNVVAVTVDSDKEHAERVRQAVREENPDIRAVVLEDPFRSFYAPLQSYVEALHDRDPDAFITIILPEFIVRHWWERFLHNTGAAHLSRIFRMYPNVAIVNVPYLIHD